MNKPTFTHNQMSRSATPTGFWKAMYVIAGRIPEKHLIWLALMLCILALGLGYLTYAGISRATESKLVIELVACIRSGIPTKPDDTP